MGVESNFLGLLEELTRHEVDFIIVGGLAAVLHGAPIMTADLDILFDTTPRNQERLLAVLEKVEARYVDPAGRQIVPDAARLDSFNLHLLHTRNGRLDLLRSIGNGQTYADLIGRTVEYQAEDLRLRVLELEAIIETKEHAGRPKDRQALPFLRELLDLRGRSGGDKG